MLAKKPPIKNAPTSPMIIFAGYLFCQANKEKMNIAIFSSVRENEKNCEKGTNNSINKVCEIARPSIPSVRLTA